MESSERFGAMPATMASLAGPGTAIPGPDVEIELDRVERELASLWAAAAPDDPGAEPAVLRACALNLLVLAGSHADLDRIRPVADQTTLAHPSRIVLLAPEVLPDGGARSDRDPIRPAEPGANGIGARISTFCHRPGDGRRHVCCEEITVLARGSAGARLPEAVLPLLLPDLPVFLWLPDSSPRDASTLERLTTLADQVIWSARRPDDRLPQRALRSRPPVGVDLDWIRLLPWRELTAQLFDAPDRRCRLERIEAVEAVVNRSPTDRPGTGWLWLGWLASRLGWVIEGMTGGPGGLRMTGREGTITANVLSCESDDTAAGDLDSLRLCVRGGPSPLVLHRHLSNEPGLLSIHECSGRCVHLGTCDEAAVLGEALNGVGRDPIYEDAWELALRLWNLGKRDG